MVLACFLKRAETCRIRLVLFVACLTIPAVLGAAEVRVRQTAGGPQIHIDGHAVPPRFFFGSSQDVTTLRYCREAGVRFVSVRMPFCWPAPGAAENWSAADAIFDQIIAVHPTALIVPRIYINAPAWLKQRHPEWLMKFKSGKDYGGVASVCAHEFRTIAAAQLERQVRHLREKYPDNYGGVHPTGQSYGEFFYLESLGGDLHGYETPVRDSWRDWLAARGEADAATAEIPTDAERLANTYGMIRDPLTERRMVLFNRFEQEELADFVAAMAAAARTGSDGKSLVLSFHGYGFEHMSVPSGPATTGDYGSEYLLTKAAGNIDIICSPFSYVNRKYLAPTMTQTAAESFALRGVMTLDEDDTRTYLVRKLSELARAGGWTRPTKAQTLRQLKSNLTACITRGRACWWMDLVSEGWYADRDLWKVMEELRPLDVEMLGRKEPYSPEIALTLDEEGMTYATAGSRAAFVPLLKKAREDFELCGTPYGQYYSSDAYAGRLKAKLQFFFSTLYADAAKRAAIAAQRTQQPDVTRVWCWAPGWASENGLKTDNIRRVTGFAAMRKAAAVPTVTATAAGRELGLPDAWSGNMRVDPLFAVEATTSETLATWPDGSAAVAVRRAGSGYEVFCGIPALNVKVIAALAKLAGCVALAEPGKAYVRAAEGKTFAEPLADNQTMGEVVRGKEAQPVSVVTNAAGNLLFDFGRHQFGWLEVETPVAGDYVFVWGELLDANGSVQTNSRYTVKEGNIRCACTYGHFSSPGVCRIPYAAGNGSAFNPKPVGAFGIVMPFRWLEVVKAPFAVTKEAVRQVPVYYPYDMEEESFSCDNEALCRVHEFCKHSIRATTYTGKFIDGDRERLPYEADSYITMLGTYAISSDQTLTRAMTDYLATHSTWPTEWKQFFVRMVHADWMRSGRTDLIRKHYRLLRDVKSWRRLRRTDGLIVTPCEKMSPSPDGGHYRDIVDWAMCYRDGFVFTPVNAVVNALHYRNLKELAEMARAIGETSDADLFETEAVATLAAYQTVFYDTANGRYRDGEGTDHTTVQANAMALACGAVPADRVAAVADYVAAKGFSCSTYMAQFVLEALFRAGRDEAAIGLMSGKDARSWLGMMEKGATVTPEFWDLTMTEPGRVPDMNHAWSTAPLNMISRFVLGVSPSVPGYGAVRIAPQPGPLRRLNAKVPTPRGVVGEDLRFEGGAVHGTVTLPEGMSGTFAWNGQSTALRAGVNAIGEE